MNKRALSWRFARKVTACACAVVAAVATTRGGAQMRTDSGADSAGLAVPQRGSHSLPGASQLVVRRAEIELAGWNRIAELLDAAVGTSRSTVDGFVLSAAGDRLNSAGVGGTGGGSTVTSEWLTFVDGVRVAANVHSLTFTELLPFTIEQIDSVRFTTGPSIINGTTAPRGALEVFTARPANGFSSAASIAIGDETGDPGPFRYTDRRSPNVEKIGPFGEARASFSTRRLALSATYHHATFSSSDTNILRRLPSGAFLRSRQYSEARTTALRISLQALGQHQLLVSKGTQFGLIYVPRDNGEADATVELTTASLSGSVIPRTATLLSRFATRMQYALGVSSLPFEPLRPVLSVADTSLQRLVTAQVSASRDINRAAVTLGAIVNRWRLESDGISRHVNGERIFGTINAPVASASYLELTVSGARANADQSSDTASVNQTGKSQHALDVSAAWTTFVSRMTSLRVSAVSVRPLGDNEATAAGHTLRGNKMQPSLTQRAAVDVEHRREFVVLRASGFVSRYANGIAQFSADSNAARSGSIASNIAFVGGSLDVETDTSSNVFVRVTIAASEPTGSGSAEKFTRSTVARELRATLSARPLTSVRTSAMLHLASATEWWIDASSPEIAPPLRRLDLSFEKWAFHRNARAQIVFRNAFNAREQSHPRGAQWNLRTLVSLSVLVP